MSTVETLASQPIAVACSARPAAISGREPMRSDSSPAIGATSIGMPVHGSVRRPASNGRVALDRLEELGEQEDRAERPEVHRQRHGVGRGEAAAAEERHRQHRVLRAPLVGDERGEQRDAGAQQADRVRRVPSPSRCR